MRYDGLIPSPPADDVGEFWSRGVVTGVDPLRVKLDVDSAPSPSTPRTLVRDLMVGDPVLVMLRYGTMTVMGRLGGTHHPRVEYAYIPDGVDLNTYTQTGVYLRPTNAGIGANYPDNRAGVLEVFTNLDAFDDDFTLGIYSHVAQRFTTYVGDVWQRHHYSGWKPWRPINVESGWQYPTLANGWVNYGGSYPPARYKKVNDIVYLQGLVKNGTVGTVHSFVLAAGFRPGYRHIFPILSNTSSGRVDITSDGLVIMHTGSSSWMSLDGISFPAEN